MKTTTLGYIEYNNHYLMLYRDERNAEKNDGSVGKWLGIGGKLEAHETADACFVREVFEETGIKLNLDQICRRGIVDFVSDSYSNERMFLYTAKVDSDYFNPNCEEGLLKWVPLSEVPSLPMWEGDKIFLDRLLEDDMNIFLSLRYEKDNLAEVIDNSLVLTDIGDEDIRELNTDTPETCTHTPLPAKDMSKKDRLKIFAGLSETQLLHYYEPEPGIFLAETPQVIRRALAAGYEILGILAEPRGCYEAISFAPGELILSTSLEKIKSLTGYNLTMGMVAAMRRKESPSIQELLSDNTIEKIAVLEDVTNPSNVGAIIRSAVALGAQALILTKGSADPLYRRSVRVSLGNIFATPYVYITDSRMDWTAALKKEGFSVISMALHNNSVFLGDNSLEKLPNKRAVVLGNESTGITDDTLNKSDVIVKIPMAEGVDSLNVAAASAVAFWELFKQ